MERSPPCNESGLKKGPWTPEEDQKLVDYIEKNGHGNWRALPKHAGLNRCGSSCRFRWTNYLRPGIKRGSFSEEEEQIILNLHAILGNKWSAISRHLPGRTDNEVKNFWNTRLKKKLIQMGYDPLTHQPRPDTFSDLSHFVALKDLIDHKLARLQRLQEQLQPQEASTNISSMNNNTFTNMDNNHTISSCFGIGGLQLVNDDSFSHHHHGMPDELMKTSTPWFSYEPPLSHGESSANSPWLLSCSSSTTPSLSYMRFHLRSRLR